MLDTNVVVSAHLKQNGLERFVFDLAIAGTLRLYISQSILAEYSAVLRRVKFAISPHLVTNSLALIRGKATLVEPKRSLAVSLDAGDNKFLECAEEAAADYLVTGDKRHYPHVWRTTRIVNSRELLEDMIPLLRSKP